MLSINRNKVCTGPEITIRNRNGPKIKFLSKRLSNFDSSLELTEWHANIQVTELRLTSQMYYWIHSRCLLTSVFDSFFHWLPASLHTITLTTLRVTDIELMHIITFLRTNVTMFSVYLSKIIKLMSTVGDQRCADVSASILQMQFFMSLRMRMQMPSEKKTNFFNATFLISCNNNTTKF